MKKSSTAPIVTRDPAEAAALLQQLGVTHAASLHVTLPAGMNGLILHPVDDLPALRRETRGLGAMIVTGRDAAEASRIAANLRRRGIGARFLLLNAHAEEVSFEPSLSPDIEDALKNEAPLQAQPLPVVEETVRPALSLNIEDALKNELPSTQPDIPQAEDIPAAPVITDAPQEAPALPENAPESKTLQPRQDTLFILLIDSLRDVPALAELPGIQPDLVIVAPASGEGTEDALAELRLCAADAAYTKGTVPAALPEDAAPAALCEALLHRSPTGGYTACLARALRDKYCLSLTVAADHAIPAIQRVMGDDATPAPLPALRLRDIDELTDAAARRTAKQRKLTAAQLRQAVHSLYAAPEGKPELDDLLAKQRAFFSSGATLEVDFRIKHLKALLRWIDEHEAEITSALFTDLGKCAFEAYETEILLVKEELKTFIRRLPAWQKDSRAAAPLVHFPSRCRTVRNPYGLALIMSPWNYPFLLSVDPLVAAIGGGNCVVLKPSAYAPATSALLRDMVDDLFDPEYAAVIEGGRKENQALLEKKFDTIFFTGSVGVGKVVMKAAAEHLTPVTLELGGKSPCIVDKTADIPLAAKRIAWGKFINAGQTCVAPDYVLCHASVKDELLRELGKAIRKFYGKEPLMSPELCHIINQTHFERLTGLMAGMEVAAGGHSDAALRKIEPTVLTNVSWDDPVMQEEIFGPILPVLTWEGDIDDLVPVIEARPRPLAAYLFTADRHAEEVFLRRLRFGGGCINDVLCHLATSSMPFGGVGESGMGHYHGKYGFETFTHLKSILKKSRRIDLPVRYAPYGEKRIRLLRRL